MKKIIAIFVVVLVGIAPYLGSFLIESQIEKEVKSLSSNGIGSSALSTQRGYLKTVKKYKVDVKDINLLATALDIDSSKIEFLQDVTMGVDVVYENIPLSQVVVMDIYPTSYAKMSELSPEGAKILSDIFKDKKLLTHLEYDISSKTYNGHMKDILYDIDMKSKGKINLAIEDFKYKGNANKKDFTFATEFGRFSLDVLDNRSSLKLDIKALSLSLSALVNKFHFDSINVELQKSNKISSVQISLDKFRSDAKVDTKGNFTAISSEISLKKINYTSKELSIGLQEINYNTSLEGIDKDKFAQLIEIVAKLDKQPKASLEKPLIDSMTSIVGSGMTFKIDNLSFSDLKFNKQSSKGFKFVSNITLKPIPDLKGKIATNSSTLKYIKYIDADSTFSISNSLFKIISNINPMAGMAMPYAKKDKDNITFHILYKDEKLLINGKGI